MANVLLDDAKIVGGENNPEEETPTASKKRTTKGGPSQPIRWVKRKATRPRLDQNLIDDEIVLIALKVGMVTNDALTYFQQNHNKYMKEMEEQMVKLRGAITQLHIEPPSTRPPSEQQSRPKQEATIDIVHFDSS